MSIGDWLENELMPKMAEYRNRIFILAAVFVILNFVVWWQIAAVVFAKGSLKIDFLDVGQGDSEMVFLSPNVKILIDGGPPNGLLLADLAKILPPTDRYIDLVVLSHPQLDHFGGLIEVLKRYKVGAFVWNGCTQGVILAFEDLKNLVAEKRIPEIVLAQKDKIRYQASVLNVLLPTSETLQSSDVNDTALVLELTSNNAKALFAGDMSSQLEAELLRFFHEPVDILKVAHHGSKYSSSAEFLKVIRPKVAVIEVGKNNYGHPTNEVLNRLSAIGASIFRTDQSGNLELVINGQEIQVFSENKSK